MMAASCPCLVFRLPAGWERIEICDSFTNDQCQKCHVIVCTLHARDLAVSVKVPNAGEELP